MMVKVKQEKVATNTDLSSVKYNIRTQYILPIALGNLTLANSSFYGQHKGHFGNVAMHSIIWLKQ